MTHSVTLAALNTMPPEQFVATLSGIYEHSPWVPERALPMRPFGSVDTLQQALKQIVEDAGDAAQLRLICAHPELAGKAAIRGELTAESTREQAGAGLDQCTTDEFVHLQKLNTDYNEKFGFPFILAIRGHDRHSIIATFAQRLANAPEVERRESLTQIHRIAALRLADLVSR